MTLPQAVNEKAAVQNPEKKSRLPKQQRRVLKVLMIFFALMAAFTILSRAADSLTVSVVEVETPERSALSHSMSAEGSIEAQKVISLQIEAGLRVAGLPVSAGQAVSKGDVLLTFDLAEVQEELETQQIALRQKELELKTAQGSSSSSQESATESALLQEDRAMEDYQQTQADADQEVIRAQEDLQTAQEDLAKAENDLSSAKVRTQQQLIDAAQKAYTEAVRAREDAEIARNEAIRTGQQAIEDAWTAIISASQSEDETVDIDYTALRRAEENLVLTQASQDRLVALAVEKEHQALAELNKAQNMPVDDESAVAAAQQAVKTARESLATRERALADAVETREKNLQNASRSIEDAQSGTEKAQSDAKKSERDATASRQTQLLEIEKIELNIELQKKEIEKIEALIESGGAVTAPVDGIVTEVNVTIGVKTTDSPYMLMTDNAEGCCFKTLVDTQDAKYVVRGDTATLTLAGQKKPVEGVMIESMRALVGDDAGKTEITASIPGDTGEVGMSATLQVIKQTNQYDVCVPVGAVGSDGVGDFVLVLREKQTVLGTELVLEKVTVNVVDKDRSKAAVEGALSSADRVMTRSAKAVKAGDRVRLGT